MEGGLYAPLNLYFMLSQRKPLKLPMKDVNITEKIDKQSEVHGWGNKKGTCLVFKVLKLGVFCKLKHRRYQVTTSK